MPGKAAKAAFLSPSPDGGPIHLYAKSGQRQQREHASGASFFAPIRIVMLEIAASADTAVGNFLDPCVATLPDDICGKINLVVRWSNTGTELHNKIARFNLKFLAH